MDFVKFKLNIEPCIQYKVIQGIPVIEFCEVSKKYEEMIEVEVLGLVPVRLLTEATHPDNTSAIDLAVYLSNLKPKK